MSRSERKARGGHEHDQDGTTKSLAVSATRRMSDAVASVKPRSRFKTWRLVAVEQVGVAAMSGSYLDEVGDS